MRQINLAKLKQEINFYPHAIQQDILKNQNRFTVVVGGKRLGKTILASYLALRELFLSNRSVWIIAPTHDLTSRIWEYLDLWIDTKFQDVFRVNKHEKIIENTVTRSKLWTKTGENPASLLGKGLDLAIIDEASRMGNGIWDGYIRPNLMDKKGRAFFISNPYGFNWFYDLYLRGTKEGQLEDPEYTSFLAPTVVEDSRGNIIGSNNPDSISIKELASIKVSTPADVWKQEYLAVFKEGVGQRFKNFESCIDESISVPEPNEWHEPPTAGRLYTIGVDIAKVVDFTVITVIDRMTHRVVGFWRMNNVSWEYMRQRIKDIHDQYNNATVTLDASGTGGDMFAEDLRAMNVDVDDFKYTNTSKVLLIDKLAILIEREKVKFPRIPQLILELRSFSYHFSSSGNLIYGSSKKDDCVNSLALACWNLNEEPLDRDDMGQPYLPTRQKYR